MCLKFFAQMNNAMVNTTSNSEMETDAKRREGSQTSQILDSCRQSARRVCSMEFLKERLNICDLYWLAIAMYTLQEISKTKRLPPLGWAPSYDLDMLTGDFIAGVTTALTVIPQGIGRSSSVPHFKL